MIDACELHVHLPHWTAKAKAKASMVSLVTPNKPIELLPYSQARANMMHGKLSATLSALLLEW
jgi:hypothetical protein